MLEFPETVANRPLLKFALENLADGSPLSLACYDAVLPLGWLHNAILRYQDHWTVVTYLWKNPPKQPAADRDRRPPDWSALQRQADAVYGPLSDNNEFGLDNRKWERELRDEMLQHRQTRFRRGVPRRPSQEPGMDRPGAPPARAGRARRPADAPEHADPRPLVRSPRGDL